MLLKVEGGQFVKDTNNKALLTVNPTALQENEARKKLASKINSKNEEINTLKNQVEELSNDISDIKMMLKQLIKN
jgi:cell division protein FtsL